MLRLAALVLGIVVAFPALAACPAESRLTHIRAQGFDVSNTLTATQVEALTRTGPEFAGLPGHFPYGPTNPEWKQLKAKQREGDFFLQFWSSQRLVERTKTYVDGVFLVRSGCVIGSIKGAVS